MRDRACAGSALDRVAFRPPFTLGVLRRKPEPHADPQRRGRHAGPHADNHPARPLRLTTHRGKRHRDRLALPLLESLLLPLRLVARHPARLDGHLARLHEHHVALAGRVFNPIDKHLRRSRRDQQHQRADLGFRLVEQALRKRFPFRPPVHGIQLERRREVFGGIPVPSQAKLRGSEVPEDVVALLEAHRFQEQLALDQLSPCRPPALRDTRPPPSPRPWPAGAGWRSGRPWRSLLRWAPRSGRGGRSGRAADAEGRGWPRCRPPAVPAPPLAARSARGPETHH